MELLKEKIINDGYVIGTKVLKVDSFLNHQIDVALFNEIGKEFKRRFQDKSITKILTVEASGIGIACIAAQYFNVPVVFAKKHEAVNLDVETYEAEVYSFTKNKSYKVRVAKKFLSKGDKVLIIDDFLANGNAAKGLIDIVTQADAEPIGVGIVIEKAFQEGRRKVEQAGVKVESLAIISSMSEGSIEFQ
jgi:xanthine phosphoribosyltransferase